MSALSGSRLPYLIVLSALIALLCGLSLLHWAGHSPTDPGAEPYPVAPGQTMIGFAHELERRGVLSPPQRWAMLAWAWLRGQQDDLKAGVYNLTEARSALAILGKITRGQVLQHRLVLIEGWSFKEIRRALATAPALRQLSERMHDSALMKRLGYPGEYPEGRFFPDTYFYTGSHSDLDILATAYNRMKQELAAAWAERDSGLPLQTPYQALVLASIIEKETAVPAERSMVAGVMINRLRKKIRLQTDPSVIYGLGDQFYGDLLRKHLRTDTPWNTYTRHGLPPTPIASPGADSIAAALHPETTHALYFVARGDGSHQFSETLEQHNKAVRKYQLKKRDPAPAASALTPR